MERRGFTYKIFALVLAVVLSGGLWGDLSAQQDRRPRRMRRGGKAKVEKVVDSLPSISDSAKAVQDSLHVADSIHRADSVSMLGKSSLDMPAFTGAKDSVIEVFTEGSRKIFYYGDVTATYGDMKLTADYMEFDLQTKILYARGTKDTVNNIMIGNPVMEQGGKHYEMEEVKYNFDTQKARITNMTTTEEEGILHGKNIKMLPDKSINLTHGRYTVCDCEHPHYYLELSAAKVMTESRNIVFGPAHPVLEDVPIPIGLPFGFVPKRPDRATGLLAPTFGEETTRGFYLRDLGVYFVLGEYFDISVTGNLYTMGSWGLDVNSRYKVNYKFNGGFGLTISNDQAGEPGAPDFFQTKNFSVKWNHSQDPKARPGTSFSASVNFSTPGNSRYNSRSVTEALESQTSSSISYSRNWNGKMNLSINALHSQNSRDSSYAVTLPNLTFSINRIYPFKQKHRVGKEKFYEKISFGYNTTFQNKINFKASEFGSPDFFNKLQSGMSHNFSIGLPNFTLLKYLNFAPGITYGMNWFFQKSDKQVVQTYDEAGNPKISIQSEMGRTFSHFGATHNYSGSMSMTTRLYGLFNFGKYHKLQAIRHVISPSLSFSYSPDKGTYFNGWRTLTYTDEHGEQKVLDYNIYEGQMNGYPGRGENGSLSLNIGNNLEAKVRDLRDTTGTGSKKIKLIDQLNISASYNFLAEKFKLSTINMNMSTSVFEKVGINASAVFDPYAIDEKGQRINVFNFQQNGFGNLLRLTTASASLSYALKGEGRTKGSDGNQNGTSGAASDYTRVYYHPVTGEYIPGGYLYYMNTNAPWSLNFNYNFNYSGTYQFVNNTLVKKNMINQTLGLSGNIKLTPRMSINMTTGFDLTLLKMTTTQISATFDLHCFNISFGWVPTGKWQSYNFRIAANAAALADLLQFKKSTSFFDNAF